MEELRALHVFIGKIVLVAYVFPSKGASERASEESGFITNRDELLALKCIHFACDRASTGAEERSKHDLRGLEPLFCENGSCTASDRNVSSHTF